MFVRTFFTAVTIIIIGFFTLLWTPLQMPLRTTFIVLMITFSATVVNAVCKHIALHEQSKFRI